MTIKRLTCRVQVKKAVQRSSQLAPEQPFRASQDFSMPLVMSDNVASEGSSQTATKDAGPVVSKRRIRPKEADPVRVADRVYDLMKQEITLGKARGGRW